MEAIRWMEHEQTKAGFDTESNASLAKRILEWMAPDPKWGGATPRELRPLGLKLFRYLDLYVGFEISRNGGAETVLRTQRPEKYMTS